MSYVNFDQLINQPLFSIVQDEMKVPLVYFSEFRAQDLAKRKEYIRIYSDGSDLVQKYSNGEVRDYKYQVSYYFQYSGDQKKEKFESKISDRTNHLYYFLLENSYYTSGTQRWFNVDFVSIGPVVWGFDEDQLDVAHVDMEVNFRRANDVPISPEIISGGDIV